METGRYAIPQMSDIVVRKRLFSFLDLNRQKRVFLILGQAAQGKSTLIASYLSMNQTRSQTLWLHMNKSESDHTKLFFLILDAFSKITGTSEYYKNLKIPQTTLGIGEEIERYGEILISIFDVIDQNINIVIDDLDSFDENASSFSLIQKIIKNLPLKISLFLLSRQAPLLSIEKLKMEKKVVVLNNDELAFTLDETEEFFMGVKGIKKVDPAEIKKIQAATEGWAGGLTLVSESMRRSPDLNKLLEHIARDAFSFFSEEIYSSLSSDLKDFLMKTSLFELLNPEVLISFCKDVPDLVAILNELEKRNLFIQKVGYSGKWPIFRYNKLFKAFLKKALLQNISIDQYKTLNIEAGRIFQKREENEQAVEYFVEAKAYKDIARTIKILGTDFVITGRFADLDKWMQALPDEMVFKDPWLIFYLTMTRRIKGGIQNIHDFKIALSLFEKDKDIRGQLLCVAYLIEATVFMRKPFSTILSFIARGEKLLKPTDTHNLFTWARTLLWQQTGFGYIAGNGDILRGISACQNAIMLAGKIDNSDLHLNASIVMILGYVQAGDFVNAQKYLSKIEGLTKEGIHPEYRVLKTLVNIDFAMKKGEFDIAEGLLSKAEIDIEKFGFLFLYPGFIEAKSMYFIHTRKYEDADKTADHLSDFSILEGNNFYQGIARGIKAINLYHQAKHKEAETESLKALKIMEKTKRSNIHFFWIKQILSFTLLHQNKFKRAQKELESCLDYYNMISSDILFVETSLAMGLLLWRENKTLAQQYIETSIKKAAKEEYVHFNVMSLNDFTKALLLGQIYGQHTEKDDISKYIFKQLSSKLSKYVLFEINSIVSSQTEQIKPVEFARLRQIYTLFIPVLRIQTLGQFKILKDKQEVESFNIEGSRPKLLLKAIVFHGGKDIPKDVLIENIWPESNAKAGEKNLKINLHRLRKALEPEVDQLFGYSYLIQKAGLISFDTNLVSIDTDDFLKLCSKGEQQEKNNQYNKAVSSYAGAVNLYKGDYFMEEPYVEWLLTRRALFRTKYIDILQKKALLHEHLDQTDLAIKSWQKALQADPLFEQAYQNLMIIYSKTAMKHKALNIFKECENIFKQELDITPDPKTQKIYEQIKENSKL